MRKPRSDLSFGIGQRILSERKRLGYKQSDFAKFGHAQLGAQQNYEYGRRSPNAEYLAGLAGLGADVLYIITGTRNPTLEGASTPLVEFVLSGEWHPGADVPFLVSSSSQITDPMCQILFVCLDASSDTHVIGRPVIAGTTAIMAPVILSRSRYTFSPAESAVVALGLKDEVEKVVKLRHQQLANALSA